MNNTFLYIITVIIWGSTWIAINYQLGDVAAEASIVYRFGLAALILFAYCKCKKLPLNIVKLELNFRLFNDDHLQTVVKRCKKLKSLDIRHTAVTFSGVKSLWLESCLMLLPNFWPNS